MKMIKSVFAVVLALTMLLTCAAGLAEADYADRIEALYGADIDEAGAALSLEKTQEQDDEIYSTLYENEDIMLCGHDGIVQSIFVFGDEYSTCGVKIGMTREEAEAALSTQEITFEFKEETEDGTPVLFFHLPEHEEANVFIDVFDDIVSAVDICTPN